jgi:hypothetical protein
MKLLDFVLVPDMNKLQIRMLILGGAGWQNGICSTKIIEIKSYSHKKLL